MNNLKDTVENFIYNHPIAGLAGTAAGGGVSLIKSITDIAQMVSALVGCVIGIFTLYVLIKKHRAKK